MQGRGGQYGWSNNHRQQYNNYNNNNYQQYQYGQNYSQQGYHQQQQQQQYGQPGYGAPSSYVQLPQQSSSQFQPPTGPSYQNRPQGNQRGGTNSLRGRGTYNNATWTRPSRPAQEEMLSVIATPVAAPAPTPVPASDPPEDDENPFRPPANLRTEDEEAEKERRLAEQADAAPTSTGSAPTGPAESNKNKISFSIKRKPTADTGQALRSDISPQAVKRAAIHESPLDRAPVAKKVFDSSVKLSSVISRPEQPVISSKIVPPPRPPAVPVKTKLVKKKVLKPKPQLSAEHAKSDSVYYRKTGNESVVGSGTYGKVYKATHVYTGKMVALKKIRMEGERDGFPVTAIREIKLLQSLRHKNVVPLREVMVESNDCYMVFEYLHHDLTGLLNHPSFVLTPAHKKHLAKQLFEGLDYLHKRGVLHRDIKAANILVSNMGELKLADFGLARFYDKRTKEDYTNRVITIWYRPPELLLGETQYDGAVDIWSAACVLVEIFLRHAIFPGNGSEIDQLDKIYNILGTPSRSEWPGIVELQWYDLLRPTARVESTFAEKFRERVTPEAFELLQAMFLYDPVNRPTAADVLAHAYFTSEQPAPAQAVELAQVEGDWHEFESKQLRKEKEKQERKRRERERESEKRKREEEAGNDAKKPRVEA